MQEITQGETPHGLVRAGVLFAVIALVACGAPGLRGDALNRGEQAQQLTPEVETSWSQARRSPRRTAYDLRRRARL
jgi:hypothetical protein